MVYMKLKALFERKYKELPQSIRVIKARDETEIKDILRDLRYKKFYNAYLSNKM